MIPGKEWNLILKTKVSRSHVDLQYDAKSLLFCKSKSSITNYFEMKSVNRNLSFRKKRKEIGKEPRSDEYIEGIDEYLGKGHILVKKPSLRYSQPDNEFWEDYVHFTKTTGTVIKNQRKLQPES